MARGRRRSARWTDPATPLQAARFARHWDADDTLKRIHKECPGHGGRPCAMSAGKLSEYETGRKRPTTQHIEIFSRVYETGPEELGLIVWRTPEERRQAELNHRLHIEDEILVELDPRTRLLDLVGLIWF